MWFYSINGLKHGPVSVQALKSLLAQRAVTPQSLVWSEGMAAWLPMDQTDLAPELQLPLVEGDAWETCAYSGEKTRRSEMVQIDGFWIATTCKDEVVEYLHQGGRLPKAELDSKLTGCLELGHLMRSSWALLYACLKPVCALYLMLWGPGQLLSSYLASPAMAGHFFAQIGGNMIVSLLVGALFNGGLFFLLGRHLHGMKPSLGEAWAAVFSNAGRLIVVGLISMVLTLIGMIMLIIPGLLIAVRLSLAQAAAMDGQLPGQAAVEKSWVLTEGHFWRTTGYLLLLGLMCGIPMVLLAPAAHLLPALHQWIGIGVLTALLKLPEIYSLAFTFCYFKELQAKRS